MEEIKVLLAIPSYNRPYDIDKKTGWWVKQIKNADVKIFVCPSQEIYYKQVLNGYTVAGAKQGEKNGFVNQLLTIKKYAIDNGYNVILKCDDDMIFKGAEKKINQPLAIDNAINLFKERFSKDKELSAIAFCQPMEWLRGERTGFKKRIKQFYGNYCIRTERYFLHDDLYLFDDLFIWIELQLNKMNKVETYLGLYQDAIGLVNKGGLQSYDRYSLSKETFITAKNKYYPEIIERENSKYKALGAFDIDGNYYKEKAK